MTAPVPQPTVSADKTPQKKPNFSPTLGPLENYNKTPDDYQKELILKHKLRGGALQRDIIMWIQLYTWGARVKTEWVRFTHTKLAELCDGADKSSVTKSIADLVARNIIAVKDGNGCTSAKYYKLTPEKWADVPPCEPASDSPPPPAQDADDTVNEEESEADPREPFGGKLIVKPGKKAARVPARLEPQGREPVDFRIEYANTGDHPVEVSASATADILLISFSARTKGESQNRQLVNWDHQEQKAKGSTISELQPRITEFAPVVSLLLLSEFETPFFLDNPNDMTFILKIVENAGPDLSPEEFETYCRSQLYIMRKKRKALIVPGLLPAFAEQAAFKHKGLKTHREAEAKNRPAPPPPPTFTPEELAILAEHEARVAQLCDRCRGRQTDPTGFRREGNKHLPVPCTECHGTGRKGGGA
jgi:hypothetical protein